MCRHPAADAAVAPVAVAHWWACICRRVRVSVRPCRRQHTALCDSVSVGVNVLLPPTLIYLSANLPPTSATNLHVLPDCHSPCLLVIVLLSTLSCRTGWSLRTCPPPSPGLPPPPPSFFSPPPPWCLPGHWPLSVARYPPCAGPWSHAQLRRLAGRWLLTRACPAWPPPGPPRGTRAWPRVYPPHRRHRRRRQSRPPPPPPRRCRRLRRLCQMPLLHPPLHPPGR